MWVLCDRQPVKTWSTGHVALMGDAAHPMLQYLAQGTAMAIEDAVQIAKEVERRPDDLPAAYPGGRTPEQAYDDMTWLYGGP